MPMGDGSGGLWGIPKEALLAAMGAILALVGLLYHGGGILLLRENKDDTGLRLVLFAQILLGLGLGLALLMLVPVVPWAWDRRPLYPLAVLLISYLVIRMRREAETTKSSRQTPL